MVSTRLLLKTCFDSSVLVRPCMLSLLIHGTNPWYLGIRVRIFGTGVYILSLNYSKSHVVIASSVLIVVAPRVELGLLDGSTEVRELG